MIKEIKKQIERQTRKKVGNVRIDTKGAVFVEQPIETPPDVHPNVVWDKTSFSRNRGEYFDLNPASFDSLLSEISRTQINTDKGNFRDISESYTNIRYSGYAGIRGAGVMSFRITSSVCSVSVWVDGKQIYASGNDRPFISTDINVYISEKSLIQIFWYCQNVGNEFVMSGDPADDLTLWEQSDITPFSRQVLWYTEDPISAGTRLGMYDWIKLQWWFGGRDLDIINWSDANQLFTGLGGFGIYRIEFSEIGELSIINVNIISVPGFHVNHRFFRIRQTVIEPEYSNYNTAQRTTHLVISNHGYSEGEIVEAGIAIRLADISFAPGAAPSFNTVFSYTDKDITHGIRYYYMVDTFDDSPNKNRGGMTSTYQTILGGDVSPPERVTNVIGTRSSYDAVTIEFDKSISNDVSEYHIWQEDDDTQLTAISGGATYFIANSPTTIAQYAIGDPVAINVNGTIYTRKIMGISNLALIFSALPESVSASDTMKLLKVVATIAGSTPKDYYRDEI